MSSYWCLKIIFKKQTIICFQNKVAKNVLKLTNNGYEPENSYNISVIKHNNKDY